MREGRDREIGRGRRKDEKETRRESADEDEHIIIRVPRKRAIAVCDVATYMIIRA